MSTDWCSDYHCAGDCGLPGHGYQHSGHAKPKQRKYQATTWRSKMQVLLFDLWKDQVLSEQQCADYSGLDLVAMRFAFDCEAKLRGYNNRDDA